MEKQQILKAIESKDTHNAHLNKMFDYYKGKHDILFRNLSDPNKPNNKIVANYCVVIADFFNSYLLGVPVQYSCKSKDYLSEIMDIFNYNDESEHNIAIGGNMNIFGYGVEILYIDSDKKIRFKNIDPRETIFIYAKDIEEELETVIRYFKVTESSYTVEVYDSLNITTYSMNENFTELTEISNQTHLFQSPPLIPYANNQILQGSFEGVIDLQDALNKLLSDELNDFEQFVDAYLVLTGLQATTSEDIAKMREDKAIILDGDSNAEWLVKSVNNDHIKELKEDITNRIYSVSKTPKVEEFSTLGSGVAIRYKMLATETEATKQERYFKRGLQRRVELITNILKLKTPNIGDYKDIDPIFKRNFIMDNHEERNRLLTEFESGLVTREEYRMKIFNETLEQAKSMLSKINELLSDYENYQ